MPKRFGKTKTSLLKLVERGELTPYAMLLDSSAFRQVERLRRTLRLRNFSEVYGLALQVLHSASQFMADGGNLARRKHGLVESLILPGRGGSFNSQGVYKLSFGFDIQAWLKSEPPLGLVQLGELAELPN